MNATEMKAQSSMGYAVQVMREEHGYTQEHVALFWTRSFRPDLQCCPPDGLCDHHARTAANITREIRRMERCSQRVYDRAQVEKYTERDWCFRHRRYEEVSRVIALMSRFATVEEFCAELVREKEERARQRREAARSAEIQIGTRLATELQHAMTELAAERLIRNAISAVDKHVGADLESMLIAFGAATGAAHEKRARSLVDAGALPSGQEQM